jgi:hypothetical protein
MIEMSKNEESASQLSANGEQESEGKYVTGKAMPLPVRSLFSGLETTFVAHLKAQRAILSIEAESDYNDAYAFLFNLATVKGFTATNVGAVIRHFKDNVSPSVKALASEDQFDESWRIFRDVFSIRDVELRNALLDFKPSKGDLDGGPKPDAPSRMLGLGIGQAAATSLLTHGDKTFEVVQSIDLSQSMIKKIAKAAKFSEPLRIFDSKDASMLAVSVGASSDHFGVTLEDSIQVELGLVCSPEAGFVTGGKGAHLAPKQQFLLMKMRDGDFDFSILSAIIDNRFDIISKLLGFDGVLTHADLKASLVSDTHLSFFASLYYFVHYSLFGEYEDELRAIFEDIDEEFNATPKSMVGVPQGAGISMVRIPFEGGYRHLTPLHNYGLMVSIHQKYDEHRKFDSVIEKDKAWAWRKLFKMVHVGGGQPQNCGAMFSSVISNGDIRALRSNVPSQISGYRLLKKNIRRGTPLFFVSKDSALDICNRASVDGVDMLVSKIHKQRAKKISQKTKLVVEQAVSFLSVVGKLLEKGDISILEYETSEGDKYFRAEREIVLNRASSHDISTYATYLQNRIYKLTNMTIAEKRVLAKSIAIHLNKQVGI